MRSCLPKFDFPADFKAPFSHNLLLNTEKSKELFKKVVFPYLKQVKTNLRYRKEKLVLIIMDNLKGQDNDMLLDLSLKHFARFLSFHTTSQ